VLASTNLPFPLFFKEGLTAMAGFGNANIDDVKINHAGR